MVEPPPPADQTEQLVPGTFVLRDGVSCFVLQGDHPVAMALQQQAVGPLQTPAVTQTFRRQLYHGKIQHDMSLFVANSFQHMLLHSVALMHPISVRFAFPQTYTLLTST